MKLRLNVNVFKEVINLIFKILLFINLLQSIPIIISLIYKEYNIAISFGISMCISIIFCSIMYLLTSNYTQVKSNFGVNSAVAALTWIGAGIFSAISLYFCGNFNSFLNAFFDSISGFTTTGFSLINDLDHVSKGVNMWRHIISYIGGQGIIVFAVVFIMKSGLGMSKIYEAEGKDEKIFPSTRHTAKFILRMSLVYLIIGTIFLTATGIYIGLKPDESFFHGLWIFMTAWSECGFAPMSQNILYYHSGLYEFVCGIFMFLGAINYILHFAILNGNCKEFFENSEIKTYLKLLIIMLIVILISLVTLRVYPNSISYARKVLFQLLAASAGSGFTTLYSSQFVNTWGGVAILILTLAMLCGGPMSSAAGGVKTFRLNVIFKSIIENIKKTVNPEGTVSIVKTHHINDIKLTDQVYKSASVIFISFIVLFFVGVTITTSFGYSVEASMFEVASAIGNVGLSMGIVTETMPVVLKYVYILMMWIARLEFISVFMLIGFIYKISKKRGVTKVEVEMDE